MHLNDLSELTSRCIHCGLCLEACPTFVITADESQSPRGRIHLVRSALEGQMQWGSEIDQPLSTCLGCRACETACPSGVGYGAILEQARKILRDKDSKPLHKAFAGALTSARALSTQLAMAKVWPGKRVPIFVSAAISGKAAEAEIPKPQGMPDWPPIPESELPEIKGEVYLLEGCVMGVLFPRVHEATRRLLRRAGYIVKESDGGCCGAMHAHLGYLDEAERRVNDLAKSYPEDIPIVVNAAGCGSTLKETLLKDRCKDLSEFLVDAGFDDYLREHSEGTRIGTYHDACHLAHGQKITDPPRRLLKAVNGVNWVDLPESDMCCGSAGMYNLTQPAIARQLLDRKWANVESTGAEFVVLSNPGCQAWIDQGSREHGGKVRVMHLAEMLEESLLKKELAH